MTIRINLSSAMKLYDYSKRNNDVHLYYIISKDRFEVIDKSKSVDSHNYILLMNCYDTCVEIIDSYLEQPFIAQYKEECKTAMKELKEGKNIIVSFLWFFDHIDGGYDFGLYEFEQVKKRMERWCKKNGFYYCWDSIEYVSSGLSWLTEERTKAVIRPPRDENKITKNKRVDIHIFDALEVGRSTYLDLDDTVKPDKVEYSADSVVYYFTSLDGNTIRLVFAGSNLLFDEMTIDY